ncbi:MAG: hypothetical protein IT370_09640 [Deltaproteobacteria bacterium]|nr:hypothetical protein [Deltaproteobacteria bacterium]
MRGGWMAMWAAGALWAAGCTFDPGGLGGPRDAALDAGSDGALDGALDGEVADAADLDGEVADAAPEDAAAPDAFVFQDAAPLDAFVFQDAADLDAFVFQDAATPDAFVFQDAAPPDAFVFQDAATPTDPGPGELWATAAGTITVDGNVDSTTEWPRARCITMTRDNDDHTDDRVRTIIAGPMAGDSSAFFCAQWSATGLYLAARVTDDTHRSNSTEIYNDDSVAFYLDGDDTRDAAADGNDFAFVVAPGIINTRADDFFRSGLPGGTLFEAQQRGANANMDIEAFIPWAALTPTHVVGSRIGFDFNLLDDDDTATIQNPERSQLDTSMWWYRRTVPGSGNCMGHEDAFCNLAVLGEIVLK